MGKLNGVEVKLNYKANFPGRKGTPVVIPE